jgi:hypothetical protein
MFVKYTGSEHFRILHGSDLPVDEGEDSFDPDTELVWEKELGSILYIEDENVANSVIRIGGFIVADAGEALAHTNALDGRQKALEAESYRLMRSLQSSESRTLPEEPEESTDSTDPASEVDDQQDEPDSSED